MNPPSLAPLKQDLWAATLAAASLLLGLFSFVWARRHPEFPWDGPILLLVSGLLLLAALRRGGRSVERAERSGETAARPTRASVDWLRGWPSLADVSQWRLFAFGLSMALMFALLSRMGVMDRSSYALEVGLWLASIAAFVLSVAPPVRRPREDWSLWWEVNRNVVLVVAAIMVVAVALRLWNLGGIPSTVGGDEGSQGIEAVNTITGVTRNPFSTGWLGMPTMSFYYNSLGIRLLGRTVEGLRLPWAIAGVASVLTTFWLITRVSGLPLGLMTAALLGTYHYHIHFSRLGANNIVDPLFVTVALLFFYRAHDRGSPLDWALAGITAGLSLYFYPGARFAIILLGVCLLFFFWTEREHPKNLRDLLGGALTLVGAFLVSAAPMLQYALRFPAEYNSRINQIGIIQSGWLAREPAVRGVSTLEVLWDQFIRAFLAFNVYPDRTVWYGSPRPLMDGIWALLFMLGLLYASFRLFFPGSDRRLFPLVAWWWGGTLLGGMLTESPPSVARLIVLAPVACFFVALALLRLSQLVQEVFHRRDVRELAPALALGVLLLSYLSVRWYFVEYTPLNVYGSRNGEMATAMAEYFQENMEPDQQVVLLGAPYFYLDFGTIWYLYPDAVADGINVHDPLTAPPDAASLGLDTSQQPLFVAVPLREQEMALVEQGFPGGQTVTIDDSRGEPLFWVYEP